MKIELRQVASVYSGKAHHCACGCSGKHRYASAHKAWASKHRGYAIEKSEINDAQVAKIVALVEANQDKAYVYNWGVMIHELYGKTYCVYFVGR